MFKHSKYSFLFISRFTTIKLTFYASKTDIKIKIIKIKIEHFKGSMIIFKNPYGLFKIKHCLMI
jgi:nitrogen fixation protein